MMSSDTVFRDMVASSDLMALSFAVRGPDLDASASADLIGFLADRFLLGHCAYLASAIARQIGREHFVAITYPDGRIAHAAVSSSPQSGGRLDGFGQDILGRRPIRQIAGEVSLISGAFSVEIGNIVEEHEFEPGEEAKLLALAMELPWMRRLLRHGPVKPDGGRLLDAATALGFSLPLTPGQGGPGTS